jgi:CPA1 family monovalent cation:H+ antiporter
VAASAVIGRLGVSGRLVAILEGESLVNDGVALVVYKLAISAAAAGAFSVGHAAAELVWVACGGVATGAVVAWSSMRLRRWIQEPDVEITLSLVMPFAAYFPAERLGVSGVLAAVTAGLLLGRRAHVTSPGTRLRRHAFWDVLVFLLNSALFLLVGLTFPDVLHRLGDVPPGNLLWHAVVIAAFVMTLRLAWVFLLRNVPVTELFVLGWSGMRGGVSLAAALSIPVAAGGHPFPGRDEIIFLTYIVLLATLVVPGLTLSSLIRRLEVGVGERQARSDARARAHLLRAALEHIDELARNEELPEDIADLLRELYESRLDGLRPVLRAPDSDGDGPVPPEAALAARRGAVAAQRAALADLEDSGEISSETARRIEEELDLEDQGYGPSL